ncbi:chorismate-binding protein [Phytohabitans kaempferiae]|uniref:Chorismate-binding protein n=1 Tax=Phytohabitans kaempferiae TaxID=1620943 RepID=A0ABV6MFW0_9ACTN
MRHFEPVVLGTLPNLSNIVGGAQPSRHGAFRERCRVEWRIGDGGDPFHVLQEFLVRHGLPVRDLGRMGDTPPSTGAAVGASVFVSAAAGAWAVGAPTGPPSPAPAVPDLVAVAYDASRPVPPAPEEERAGWHLGGWRASWTPRAHAGAVRAVRAAISRGDVYQVNVVGHAAAPYLGDPLPALRRLAGVRGARYAGVLTGTGWAIGCASPETLVEVAGGRVVTRPIKGTRPATEVGRRELLASAKERAEHVMIVDLERNDLARVARTGSVRVDELFAIRRWCDLWQAESVVSAEPVAGLGLADLLRAVCPGGSVTGAPKLAALAEIAALEPVGRGPSMGALGWVGHDRIDLGLTIRTAAADGERLHLWAGGGITWGSDPEAEVAEAAAKAAPLRAALAGPA